MVKVSSSQYKKCRTWCCIAVCIRTCIIFLPMETVVSLLECHTRIERMFLESGCCRLPQPVGIRVTDLTGRTWLFSWSWRCREASGTENKYGLTEIIVIAFKVSSQSEAWKRWNNVPSYLRHENLAMDIEVFTKFFIQMKRYSRCPFMMSEDGNLHLKLKQLQRDLS